MPTRFLFFLIAQAVSQFGTAVSSVGLATLWAVHKAPAFELALLLALPAIPSLLIGPFVGATAERASLRPYLVCVNLLLGGIACALAWAISPDGGHSALPLLLGLFTLKEIGNRAFSAGYARTFGVLSPATTGRPVMLADFVSQSGSALGAAVGGLVAIKGSGEVFIIDAVSFLVAGAILCCIPLAHRAPAQLAAGEEVQTGQTAVDHVSGNIQVGRLFAAYCVMSLTWAAWDISGAYLFTAAGSAEASGVANSGAQVGKMLTGGWLYLQQLGHSSNKALASGLVLAGTGVVAGGLGLLRPSSYAVALLVILRTLFGITGYLGGNGSYTLMVLDAPAELRARMAVLVGTVGTGIIAGGAKLIVGLLNDRFGPATAFLLPSLLGAALSLALCRAEFRTQRRQLLLVTFTCRLYWAQHAGGLTLAANRDYLARMRRI
jgi:Transmembrane secretion effector